MLPGGCGCQPPAQLHCCCTTTCSLFLLQPPFHDTFHYHKQQDLFWGGVEEVCVAASVFSLCMAPGVHMQEDLE